MRCCLKLCAVSPATIVYRKEVMFFHCELVSVTLTETYATCNSMAFVHGEDQGVKLICIRIEVKYKVEDFLNIWLAKLWLVEESDRNGERYIEKPSFGNGTKSCARDGPFWICSSDGKRRAVKRWAMRERKPVLLETGKMPAVKDVQLGFVLSSWAHGEDIGV